MHRTFAALGGILGFFGVAFGAFGTHALKSKLSPDMLGVWQTGVQYQMVHALALILAGCLYTWSENKNLLWAGRLFFAGTCIFSGSLYLLAVSGVGKLGAITPIGGVCLLSGWVLLVLGVSHK